MWRSWWFWNFYVLLLVASLGFAAYYGDKFFRGAESPPNPPAKPVFDSLRRSHGRIGPPAPQPDTGPGEMTDNPLAGVGMRPLDGDPDGIAPPEGAERRSAFVRRGRDEVEMMARYAWRGSVDQAAAYYKEYLSGKGMKFLGQQTRSGRSPSTRPGGSRKARARRIFVFRGPRRHITVTCREMSGNDKMLSITLNLAYPGAQRP